MNLKEIGVDEVSYLRIDVIGETFDLINLELFNVLDLYSR